MSSLVKKFMMPTDSASLSASLLMISQSIARTIVLPLIGIAVFLLLWSVAASQIDTSLGKFPGPKAVGTQIVNLYQEHQASREKEQAFYQRQEVRNAKRLAKDPNYQAKIRAYTGKETFIDQIGTSLVTVMSGFIVAAIIAIPLGIAIGMSKSLKYGDQPNYPNF